ncbi:hypothetical protein PIB30_049343 [Stylosanthes scabra]|uniref:Uncharacterized protein n=1 Tax=Stylosanthes scabra TaxID=79078 RepID=A0ABU6ZG52_9FABA|nr:hypothetical protein [Stylosanthes scabra]
MPTPSLRKRGEVRDTDQSRGERVRCDEGEEEGSVTALCRRASPPPPKFSLSPSCLVAVVEMRRGRERETRRTRKKGSSTPSPLRIVVSLAAASRRRLVAVHYRLWSLEPPSQRAARKVYDLHPIFSWLPLSGLGYHSFEANIFPQQFFGMFLEECLEEFNMTYDDTSLRGNGLIC